jgi:hypothetical protein
MPTPAHFDVAKVYTSVHAGGTIAGLSEGARDAFRVRDRASVGDRRLMIGAGPIFAHRVAGDRARPLRQFAGLKIPARGGARCACRRKPPACSSGTVAPIAYRMRSLAGSSLARTSLRIRLDLAFRHRDDRASKFSFETSMAMIPYLSLKGKRLLRSPPVETTMG